MPRLVALGVCRELAKLKQLLALIPLRTGIPRRLPESAMPSHPCIPTLRSDNLPNGHWPHLSNRNGSTLRYYASCITKPRISPLRRSPMGQTVASMPRCTRKEFQRP